MSPWKEYSALKLIIFDWDGTLFDSTGVIAYSLQQAVSSIDLPTPDINQTKKLIGLGFDKIIKHLLGDISDKEQATFINEYRKAYLANENFVTLFDGIDSLLSQLKQQGKFLAIATGKSRASLDRVLEQNAHLKTHFISTKTADQTQSKPHPQMLTELLNELNISPQDAVMIGDTTYDIRMAQAANVNSVAVTYGAHDALTLRRANPTFLADSVEELSAILSSTNL